MNPYKTFPARAFWRPSVANKSKFDITDLWDPKFPITRDHKISTYGSCFAQEIGKALDARDYNWLRTETPPAGMNDENLKKFNYGVFSSRTTNIYTTSFFRQWTEWALDPASMPDEIWEVDGRFLDPFRPTLEPGGFASEAEVRVAQETTREAFKASIADADYFVFTMGLTERWMNRTGKYEYSICPGTAGGEFDDKEHIFSNMTFHEVRNNLVQAIDNLRKINKNLKIILTVSPVPLVATASGQHVLLATMYSKSVLRAVAGQMMMKNDYIDYFPSYELVSSPTFEGTFFQPDKRSVNPHGVRFIMDCFFSAQAEKFGKPARSEAVKVTSASSDGQDNDLVCEEELLAAFGEEK